MSALAKLLGATPAILALLLLFSCGDSSGVLGRAQLSPVSISAPKTPSDVTQLVKTAGPSLLKTFRSRMSFIDAQVQVTEQTGAFAVSVQIRYHSFLKQNPRTAHLSFQLSANGLVSQCVLQDPVNKAGEVSCSRLETKIGQLFKPAFQ